jgi:putative addiction module component (TIGR02574 family)
MHVSDFPDIARLSIQDKIELIDLLWDVIAPGIQGAPVPDSHQRELEHRLDEVRSNPSILLTEGEFKTRINRMQ